MKIINPVITVILFAVLPGCFLKDKPDAIKYHDAILELAECTNQKDSLLDVAVAHSDPQTAEQLRLQILTTIDSAKRVLKNITPYNNDAILKKAADRWLKSLNVYYTVGVKKGVELMSYYKTNFLTLTEWEKMEVIKEIQKYYVSEELEEELNKFAEAQHNYANQFGINITKN